MSTTRSGKIYRMESCPDPGTTQESKFRMNNYLAKKTITQGLLDVALLTANVSQLKYVYSVGSIGPNGHPFYHLMMTLISLSIILQVTTALCLILLGKRLEDFQLRHSDILNNLVTIQVFFITVINIMISSFGIEESVIRERKLDDWSRSNQEYFANCTCIQPLRLYASGCFENQPSTTLPI